MRPGDVLIFTAHTVHRGTPNTGTGPRMSMDVRYQCESEPISETCLELRDEGYD
ncbi:phytanoyl-CoA dioxygenase family protein [Streptomyces sp. HU2014]|nr:phytanoyl-CoA dioxygenase family protein [Streptomyces sp. HU2014]